MDIVISNVQAFELGFFFAIGSSLWGLITGMVVIAFTALFNK